MSVSDPGIGSTSCAADGGAAEPAAATLGMPPSSSRAGGAAAPGSISNGPDAPSQSLILRDGVSGDDGSCYATAPVIRSPAPVPDALLSLAKSSRYTSYLSDLLSDLVAPYLAHYHASNNNNIGNGNGSRTNSSSSWKLIGALKPEMDLLAALLHAMLVMWRQGRSMGMDVTGLRYCPEESLVRPRKRGTKAGGSGGGNGDSSESLGLAPADAQLVSPPTSTPSRMATTLVPSSLSEETKSLPEQLGTYSRSLLFVALTVLPPYLAARCGRAGKWDELKALFFPSSSDGNVSTTAASSGHMGGTEHNSGTANNSTVEHLRGKSRREIFEERRRAMMQMASRIESGHDIGSVARGDGGSTPTDRNGEAIREGGDDHTTHNTTSSGGQSQRDRVRRKYLEILHRLCRSGTDWFRVS